MNEGLGTIFEYIERLIFPLSGADHAEPCKQSRLAILRPQTSSIDDSGHTCSHDRRTSSKSLGSLGLRSAISVSEEDPLNFCTILEPKGHFSVTD